LIRLGPAAADADRAGENDERNVFENAIEASPTGSAISLRCSSVANGNPEGICIAIEDRGPGLTDQQQKRIFEPFYTTKSKGTGLGMAIVQRIVQSHGGTVIASSPHGACIEITLPRGEASSAQENQGASTLARP
jgi:signal transduction histidine kinase